MGHRSRFGDRLASMAPAMPAPLRVFWARAASRRGLHVAALRAAPNDPWVLANLGMFHSAAENERVKIAKAVALAGLGDVERAQHLLGSAPRLTARQRAQLARVVAPFDPQAGLNFLAPGPSAEKAACLIAAGMIDEAEAILTHLGPSREAGLLRAACSTRRGANRQARIQLNATFARDGLEPPFVESDEPLALGALNDLAAPAPVDPTGPCVSVVIAARNAAGTLGMALDSLRRQTWRNLEILVIDDGSTDGTVDVVIEQARSDQRIALLRNTGVGGAYGARNSGIAAARGAYLTFHDADDWAHPRRIERQVAVIGSNGMGSVCSHIRLSDAGDILAPRVFPLARINPILLMVRREALVRWGGFDLVRLGGDSELLARMDAIYGRQAVARVQEILVIAGWSGSSLMGAAHTGLKGDGAKLRVAYVEAWRRRHANGRYSPEASGNASLAFADKTWR